MERTAAVSSGGVMPAGERRTGQEQASGQGHRGPSKMRSDGGDLFSFSPHSLHRPKTKANRNWYPLSARTLNL